MCDFIKIFIAIFIRKKCIIETCELKNNSVLNVRLYDVLWMRKK